MKMFETQLNLLDGSSTVCMKISMEVKIIHVELKGLRKISKHDAKPKEEKRKLPNKKIYNQHKSMCSI